MSETPTDPNLAPVPSLGAASGPPRVTVGTAVAATPSGATPVPGRQPPQRSFDKIRLAVQVLTTAALGAGVTTYVAVQVDLLRRHFPGIEPSVYWAPQVKQITLPGLGATLLLTVAAFAVHKFARKP